MSNHNSLVESHPLPLHIHSLPSSLSSSLRSGPLCSSLSQLISDLCENSLDAAASNIEISYSVYDATVICTDNGVGITPASLELLGNRCASSKRLGQVGEFGWRGEAVASAQEMGKVIVTTRP